MEKTYRFPAHFKRFCEAQEGCYTTNYDPLCPLRKGSECAIAYAPDIAEEIIMSWVLDNPGPKPVTWVEWWLGMFPGASIIPCLRYFFGNSECPQTVCEKCRKETIVPDDVVKAFESVPRPVRAAEKEGKE